MTRTNKVLRLHSSNVTIIENVLSHQQCVNEMCESDQQCVEVIHDVLKSPTLCESQVGSSQFLNY